MQTTRTVEAVSTDYTTLKAAFDAIMYGRFLLEHSFSETEVTERYVGRLL